MYSLTPLLHRLCLVVAFLTPFPVCADSTADVQPDVRAILFFGPDSAQYQDLFAYYLPALMERNQARLEISAIDASRDPGATLYQTAATHFDLPPQWDGTPMVLAGNRSMVGLMEIGRMLGDRFDEVAAFPGAANWPSLPGLAPLVAPGKQDLEVRTAQDGAPPIAEETNAGAQSTVEKIADALALAVLSIMVVVLILSLLRLRRRGMNPGPLARFVLLLALLTGFGISGYTAYTAFAGVVPMCGPAGGCGSVQQSEYAKLFGIPMGVFGLLGYSSILITWLMAQRLSPNGGGWRWLPWAIAFAALLFSVRLMAIGYFVIGATCLWCLGSAVSITVIFWLLAGHTRSAGTP